MTPLLLALSFAGAGQVPREVPTPPQPPSRSVIVQPPRDPGMRPPPEPTGTGVIRGRVVAADTGNPIRRATVNLSQTPPSVATTASPIGAAITVTRLSTAGGANTQTVTVSSGFVRPKTVTTDAQGVFTFTGLPQGT